MTANLTREQIVRPLKGLLDEELEGQAAAKANRRDINGLYDCFIEMRNRYREVSSNYNELLEATYDER